VAWMPANTKDYVLVLLFIKYVSDKYAGVPQRVMDVSASARHAPRPGMALQFNGLRAAMPAQS